MRPPLYQHILDMRARLDMDQPGFPQRWSDAAGKLLREAEPVAVSVMLLELHVLPEWLASLTTRIAEERGIRLDVGSVVARIDNLCPQHQPEAVIVLHPAMFSAVRDAWGQRFKPHRDVIGPNDLEGTLDDVREVWTDPRVDHRMITFRVHMPDFMLL